MVCSIFLLMILSAIINPNLKEMTEISTAQVNHELTSDWISIISIKFENMTTNTIYTLDCSPNGLQIACAIQNKICLYDPLIQKFMLNPLFVNYDNICSLKYTPDSIKLAAGTGSRIYKYDAECKNYAIYLWDCINYKLLRVFEGHEGSIYSIDISRDGSTIISGSDDGTIKVWEIQSDIDHTINAHGDGILCVQYSTDENYIVSGSKYGIVCILNAKSRSLVKQIYSYSDYTSSVYMHGSQIVSNTRNGEIRLWNYFTGQYVRRMLSDQQWLLSIAYRADSRLIISASWGQTLKLFDQRTLKQLRAFKRLRGRVYKVQFSPNGRFIVDGSDDGITITPILR